MNHLVRLVIQTYSRILDLDPRTFRGDFGNYIIPAGFSFEFARLNEIHRDLILLIGAAWLALTAWSVTGLHNPSLHEGTV